MSFDKKPLLIIFLAATSLVSCKTRKVSSEVYRPEFSHQELNDISKNIKEHSQQYVTAQGNGPLSDPNTMEAQIDAAAAEISQAVLKDLRSALTADHSGDRAVLAGAIGDANRNIAGHVIDQNDAGCFALKAEEKRKPGDEAPICDKPGQNKANQGQIAAGAVSATLGGVVAIFGLISYLKPELRDKFALNQYQKGWQAKRALAKTAAAQGELVTGVETELANNKANMTLLLKAEPMNVSQAMEISIFEKIKGTPSAAFTSAMQKLADAKVLTTPEITAVNDYFNKNVEAAAKASVSGRIDARMLAVIEVNRSDATGIKPMVEALSKDVRLKAQMALQTKSSVSDQTRSFKDLRNSLDAEIKTRDKATRGVGVVAMGLGFLTATIGVIAAGTGATSLASSGTPDYIVCSELSEDKQADCRNENRSRYTTNLNSIAKNHLGLN